MLRSAGMDNYISDVVESTVREAPGIRNSLFETVLPPEAKNGDERKREDTVTADNGRTGDEGESPSQSETGGAGITPPCSYPNVSERKSEDVSTSDNNVKMEDEEETSFQNETKGAQITPPRLHPKVHLDELLLSLDEISAFQQPGPSSMQQPISASGVKHECVKSEEVGLQASCSKKSAACDVLLSSLDRICHEGETMAPELCNGNTGEGIPFASLDNSMKDNTSGSVSGTENAHEGQMQVFKRSISAPIVPRCVDDVEGKVLLERNTNETEKIDFVPVIKPRMIHNPNRIRHSCLERQKSVSEWWKPGAAFSASKSLMRQHSAGGSKTQSPAVTSRAGHSQTKDSLAKKTEEPVIIILDEEEEEDCENESTSFSSHENLPSTSCLKHTSASGVKTEIFEIVVKEEENETVCGDHRKRPRGPVSRCPSSVDSSVVKEADKGNSGIWPSSGIKREMGEQQRGKEETPDNKDAVQALCGNSSEGDDVIIIESDSPPPSSAQSEVPNARQQLAACDVQRNETSQQNVQCQSTTASAIPPPSSSSKSETLMAHPNLVGSANAQENQGQHPIILQTPNSVSPVLSQPQLTPVSLPHHRTVSSAHHCAVNLPHSLHTQPSGTAIPTTKDRSVILPLTDFRQSERILEPKAQNDSENVSQLFDRVHQKGSTLVQNNQPKVQDTSNQSSQPSIENENEIIPENENCERNRNQGGGFIEKITQNSHAQDIFNECERVKTELERLRSCAETSDLDTPADKGLQRSVSITDERVDKGLKESSDQGEPGQQVKEECGENQLSQEGVAKRKRRSCVLSETKRIRNKNGGGSKRIRESGSIHSQNDDGNVSHVNFDPTKPKKYWWLSETAAKPKGQENEKSASASGQMSALQVVEGQRKKGGHKNKKRKRSGGKLDSKKAKRRKKAKLLICTGWVSL